MKLYLVAILKNM